MNGALPVWSKVKATGDLERKRRTFSAALRACATCATFLAASLSAAPGRLDAVGTGNDADPLPVAASRTPPRHYPDPVLPFDDSAPAPPADDSLAEAIAEAYATNPALAAHRYEQRATDDALGIALSGYRPTMDVQVSGGYSYTDPGRITQAARPLAEQLTSTDIRRNDLGSQLVIEQPLTTGGRTRSEVAAARADVVAGQAQLRGSEGDMLYALMSAYSDVYRDSRALGIRERNELLMSAVLREIEARRDAGELTRTDLAQAETQLQSARVQIDIARAQLQQSRAAFAALVGREAGRLAAVPELPGLPASIDQAFDQAGTRNPELLAAISAERASRARIKLAEAQGAPSLSLRGVASITGQAVPFHFYNEDKGLSLRATLTIPLSAGGRIASQVEQATDRNSVDLLKIEVARRQMVQSIVNAWNQMVVAARNREAQSLQLKSVRVYYDGTYQEYRAGLRSTLDVLFALNSLRDTEIAIEGSRRDEFVAQAALLRQLGTLEVGKLLQGAKLYDPAVHARSVARARFTPLDPVVRVLDHIGLPSPPRPALAFPPSPASAPVMMPAAAATDAAARPVATQSPPAPGPVR